MNTREAAFLTLFEVEKKKFSGMDSLMEKFHQKLKNEKDRALFVELVHGVLRYKNLIDYYINFVTKKGVKDKRILNILRVATYELLFLEKIPEYATVNEACEVASKISPHLKAFVNAILRNIIRNKNQIEESLERIKEIDLKSYISIKLSYPKFLIDYLEESYGFEKALKILEFLNTRPPVGIKINTKKTNVDILVQELRKSGVEYEVNSHNSEIIYILKGNIKDTQLYKQGYFYFQDLASSLVVGLNKEDFKKAKKVLDLCAAPGGKTFNCAEVIDGFVVACDINDHKLDVLRENILRLGFDNIIVAKSDAEIFNPDFAGRFDIVIADLPCTGFGAIRKKPDIKWNKSYQDIENLHELQVRILDNAASYLKRGGLLFYSTCTLGRKENEETVLKFLDKHKDFSLVSQITIFPDEFKCDGFFISKLRKEGER
ncbi:16S rRNA (cytosine(967)-C(5))-methyltransferase RsmB [Caldicellulosiruptor owensensis]|uniref:16S rRNA (cytosine(967)-C(5))-methyltransferase RsmB n=1 Tax=Caldicellulosiruptor owensensis TaxID=55205 RepID=UPI0009FE715D|nr:16S rRNA (cytosine(967)-C(5))-methyltransferase RsmB [Caldicellulosiruptor owensensis]